jgi:ankyrin repeat protein
MDTVYHSILDGNLRFVHDFLSNLEPKDRKKLFNSHWKGQTCLTLAASTGNIEMVDLLLSFGASCRMTNEQGWTARQEAVSFGNRELILRLTAAQRAETSQWLKHCGKEALDSMKDCSFIMKWQIQSWLPLVGRICPSDSYMIHKKGQNLRIDLTLVGFENLSWIRGKLSLMMINGKIYLMDHDRRLIQQLYPPTEQIDLEEDVSISLNSPLRDILDIFPFTSEKTWSYCVSQ